jgi:hypothetical protein
MVHCSIACNGALRHCMQWCIAALHKLHGIAVQCRPVGVGAMMKRCNAREPARRALCARAHCIPFPSFVANRPGRRSVAGASGTTSQMAVGPPINGGRSAGGVWMWPPGRLGVWAAEGQAKAAVAARGHVANRVRKLARWPGRLAGRRPGGDGIRSVSFDFVRFRSVSFRSEAGAVE